MQGDLTGKLLIAMPGIADRRFERAVILMCAHSEDSAMGVIINKPKEEITLGDVLTHLGIVAAADMEGAAVLDGGPVRPDRGYVIHTADFEAPAGASQEIGPDMRLTATREVLESLGSMEAPRQFVLALGYAGWGAGQLENELAGHAWLVADADRDIIFSADHDAKWRSAVRAIGIDPAQLSGEMGRA
jgi:putative transcriptional regulator